MKTYTQWTESQFRQLLANEELSDEDLAARIGRTPGAVGVVRAGVQLWRNGEEHNDILSQMMIRVLSENAGQSGRRLGIA